VNTSGQYSVTVSGGGCSGSASISIIVHDNPPQPEITVSGDTLTSSSALLYEWYLNGNPLGINAPQLIATQNGCYQVAITNAEGCSAISDSVCLLITEILPLSENGIHLYPNPFEDKLFITLSHLKGDENLFIYDINGKLCFHTRLVQKETALNMKNLNKGIYLVAIRNAANDNLISRRIIRY
jgi:hypothetical protein